MKTLPLQWFTNAQILTELGRELLAKFLARFRDDLAWSDIYLPNPESQTPHYFNQVATLLKSPQSWPHSFEQALLAIEHLASPEMQPRREALLAQAQPELRLDPASSPQRLAIQLWLHSPYRLIEGELIVDVPAPANAKPALTAPL